MSSREEKGTGSARCNFKTHLKEDRRERDWGSDLGMVERARAKPLRWGHLVHFRGSKGPVWPQQSSRRQRGEGQGQRGGR